MTVEEEQDSEILCGIGKFKPKWLQVFNNSKAMCVFITIYAFTHGEYIEVNAEIKIIFP